MQEKLFEQNIIPNRNRERFTAEKLRDKGIEQSEKHANEVNKNWSEKAYAFFIQYARNIGKPFMTADIVEAAKGIVPDPPDFRSYGAIAVRAIKAGVVRKIGYSCGTNPRHHRNPRTLFKYNKA